MNLADKPPHKELITEFIETQKNELAAVGVEVRLNTPGTVDAVKALNPYGVVVAVGGDPIRPNVPGIDGANVYSAEDILAGKVSLTGQNIAVIGGGVTGLETAEVLGENNKVAVIEMMGAVGTTLYPSVRGMLLKRLGELGVEIVTDHSLTGIGEGRINLIRTSMGYAEERRLTPWSSPSGVRPRSALVEEFEAAFDKVTAVGDARRVGLIADATREANDKAFVF